MEDLQRTTPWVRAEPTALKPGTQPATDQTTAEGKTAQIAQIAQDIGVAGSDSGTTSTVKASVSRDSLAQNKSSVPDHAQQVAETLLQHVVVDDTSKPMTPVEMKTDRQRAKISKLDVSGMKSPREKFIKKAGRYLNFVKLIGGFVNAHTIMTGASKIWEPERLAKGKHDLLAKAGGEHVQLKSSTGSKVDGHYMSASGFAKKLEELGGRRTKCELELKDTTLFTGTKCNLEIDGDFTIKMMELNLNEEQKVRSKSGRLEITDEISAVTGKKIVILEDPKTGKFYTVDQRQYQKLMSLKLINWGGHFTGGKIVDTGEKTSLLPEKTDFPMIKFDKKSSQWEEAVKMLKDMKIEKTNWTIVEKDDAVYLVPAKNEGMLEQGLADKLCSLSERSASSSSESSERGTVLLTMNQTDIYEQHPHEMLTFMLEGVNVMAYNNPGKGMSTGAADRENINASIEATYQYLKQRGIPDEKILAKGQCFGGAPTAWLSGKHPDINVMLDQNPANFHEVAMQKVNSAAEGLMTKDKGAFSKWIGKMLKDNFIINGLARAVLGGYDVPTDLAHNKGHKLLNINTPDERGKGEDELVPTHHPETMLDAMQDNPDKIVSLSMNPGASHVTDWWVGDESQNSVLQFLSRTGLSESLFETRSPDVSASDVQTKGPQEGAQKQPTESELQTRNLSKMKSGLGMGAKPQALVPRGIFKEVSNAFRETYRGIKAAPGKIREALGNVKFNVSFRAKKDKIEQQQTSTTQERHGTYIAKLGGAVEKMQTQLKRLEALDARYPDLKPEEIAEKPLAKQSQGKLEEAKAEFKAVLEELAQLPPAERELVLKQMQMHFAKPENSLAFDHVMENLGNNEAPGGVVKTFIEDMGRIRAPVMQLGEVDRSAVVDFIQSERGADAKPVVTVLCPLMIDGMGDLGIAMNALDAIKEKMGEGVSLKLVVMVGAGHPASADQLNKVKQMVGKDASIHVVEMPFSYQTGGPGSVKSASPEARQQLQDIFSKTDVLLNLPVDYKHYLAEVRELMPPESRVVVGTEYGLRQNADAAAASKPMEDQRIESGPGKVVYLNEGKLSEDRIVDLLRADANATAIIPSLATASSAKEAIEAYSKDNNLAVFYLNKDTPAATTRLFFEQYLDIHKDDPRALNILGNIPQDLLMDKKFQKVLKEKYGIGSVVIQEKGKEPRSIKISSKGKPLNIYAGYSFPKETFRAVSEFSLHSSRGYPNLMFAAGDGSFSDALSLMVNYSQNPQDPGYVASIPVFITRLKFHDTSVAEMIQLCDDIGEPKLKELFEKLAEFKKLETLSPDEMTSLTDLIKSDEVRVGLSRLAQTIANEHNFSRTIINHVESELMQVVSAKKAKAEEAQEREAEEAPGN